MTKRRLLRAAGLAAALALLCGLLLTGALADGTPNLKTYKKAMDYVKKNAPMTLTLEKVRFTPKELLAIKQAMPEGAELHFSTNWKNARFADTSEEVDLRECTSGVKEADLEAIIALCPNVKTINNAAKRYPSNDVMIPLIEKYPEIRFEWVVHLGGGHYCPTTATAWSTFNEPSKGYKLTSEHMELMKYVPGLKALDLGHNRISSLDWLRNFPDMEFLILGDNQITDLTPLGDLPHLKYVEIFSQDVTDLSPLANCHELLDVNFTYCKLITDLSPLDGIETLERFWGNHLEGVPEAEKERFIAAHPNTQVMFKGPHATSDGWRKHPRYKHYIWCLKNRQWVPFDQPLPTKKSK